MVRTEDISCQASIAVNAITATTSALRVVDRVAAFLAVVVTNYTKACIITVVAIDMVTAAS